VWWCEGGDREVVKKNLSLSVIVDLDVCVCVGVVGMDDTQQQKKKKKKTSHTHTHFLPICSLVHRIRFRILTRTLYIDVLYRWMQTDS
jgi:hypothetical protein